MNNERGVRQGYVLSPTLFSLYGEELVDRMRIINAGVCAGNDKICVFYADDVIIMSQSADELQSLLDVVDVYIYGREFGVGFSSEKSKVVKVKRSEHERVREEHGKDCNKLMVASGDVNELEWLCEVEE